jgi:ribosome-associated translation inhibitor RaiA
MTTIRADIPIQLTLRGAAPQSQIAYVLRKVEHLVQRPPAAAQQVQVVIALDSNPATERPVRIEVSAVVAGKPIRAHVQATEVTEAGDLVVDRLQQRLDRARERTRTRRRRGGIAGAHEWRHGGLPPHRGIEHRGDPNDGSRPVIKRKTYLLEPMTAEQAADEMELLDHDFYLFVDADTGADAVVHRRHDGSFGVLGPTAGATGPHESCGAPPALTAAQAKERLEVSTDRFLFYRDPSDDRARVLYRRYDGRFGLLVAS